MPDNSAMICKIHLMEDKITTKGVTLLHVATDVMLAITIIVSLVLFPGCGHIPRDVNVDSSEEVTGAGSLEAEPLRVYLDFDDISVPSELKLDKQRSFVYETAAIKA